MTLFKYDIGTKEFTKVDDVNQANSVKVDFFRPDSGDYTTITSQFPYSQNYVVMVFNESTTTILKAQVKFFEKTDGEVGKAVGVYPIKTGDQAFEDLKNKKGIIITPGNQETVTIKSMKMGYYDPDFYQSYLEPVYYFIGENGFVAYVPAIIDQYIATGEASLNP